MGPARDIGYLDKLLELNMMQSRYTIMCIVIFHGSEAVSNVESSEYAASTERYITEDDGGCKQAQDA